MKREHWQHASVTLPSLGPIAARLLVRESGLATAVLLARPIRTLRGSIGEVVGVDVTTRHEERHHEASIIDVPSGEVLELQLHAPGPRVQRRDLVRVEAAVAVTVSPGRPGSATVQTRTLDVSGGGALIAHLEALAMGDRAQLALDLGDGHEPLVLLARVVRVGSSGLRGMRFEAITESQRDRIVRFVFARERAARRTARDR